MTVCALGFTTSLPLSRRRRYRRSSSELFKFDYVFAALVNLHDINELIIIIIVVVVILIPLLLGSKDPQGLKLKFKNSGTAE